MAAPNYRAATGPRLTQSEVEQYLRCGILYFKARERKHRRTTIRMAVGTGVAWAAYLDNRAKKLTGGPPQIRTDDLVEAAVEEYRSEIQGCELRFSPPDYSEGERNVIRSTTTYMTWVSPRIEKILAAEEPAYMQIDEGLEFAGTADVVTEFGVGDLKVGQPWTQARADLSRQLTAYAMLHKAALGKLPGRVWIDSISKGGWDRWNSIRTYDSIERYKEIIRRVYRLIEAGAEIPAPEAAWWCSPKWCPEWTDCPVMGGKDATWKTISTTQGPPSGWNP